MLTVKQVANELAVSTACVYQLIRSGKLASHRIGIGRGTIRIAKSDLAEFIDANRKEKRPDQPAAQSRPQTRSAFKHLRLDWSPDSAEQPGAEDIATSVDRRGQASTDQNGRATLQRSSDRHQMSAYE